jgi:hypothetical protein
VVLAFMTLSKVREKFNIFLIAGRYRRTFFPAILASLFDEILCLILGYYVGHENSGEKYTEIEVRLFRIWRELRTYLGAENRALNKVGIFSVLKSISSLQTHSLFSSAVDERLITEP